MRDFLTGNSPVVKGLRTFVQAIFGFVAGLAAVVWAVPGVPEAVTDYLSQNLVQLLTIAGISAGGFAWLWNAIAAKAKK